MGVLSTKVEHKWWSSLWYSLMNLLMTITIMPYMPAHIRVQILQCQHKPSILIYRDILTLKAYCLTLQLEKCNRNKHTIYYNNFFFQTFNCLLATYFKNDQLTIIKVPAKIKYSFIAHKCTYMVHSKTKLQTWERIQKRCFTQWFWLHNILFVV